MSVRKIQLPNKFSCLVVSYLIRRYTVFPNLEKFPLPGFRSKYNYSDLLMFFCRPEYIKQISCTQFKSKVFFNFFNLDRIFKAKGELLNLFSINMLKINLVPSVFFRYLISSRRPRYQRCEKDHGNKVVWKLINANVCFPYCNAPLKYGRLYHNSADSAKI